jgi:translin
MRHRINENTIYRDLESITRMITSLLDKKDSNREKVIKVSRDLIRCSGYIINYIVANDVEKANNMLEKCSSQIIELDQISSLHPELLKGGLGLQAIIEFCEAEMLYNIITGSTIKCSYGEKYPEAYLLALCDLSGELKRLAILELSTWNIERAKQYIDIIKSIYNNIKILDYPDPITPGLRHKIDVLRRHIEDLETLYTDIKTRKELIDIINKPK